MNMNTNTNPKPGMAAQSDPAGGGCGRIYVDFDDVLSETARCLIGLLERRFGRTVPYESICDFDLRSSFRLTAEEERGLMDEGHTAEVLRSMQAVPHAVETLREWDRSGYRVWVVTGRPPSTQAASREWLDARGVPYSELVFVDKYSRLYPGWGAAKAVTLDEFRLESFDLAVEDSADMASFLWERMGVPVALLGRPWNQRVAIDGGGGGIVRCRDWRDIGSAFPLAAPGGAAD
jgi:uncharacterized HAD superfamily protein